MSQKRLTSLRIPASTDRWIDQQVVELKTHRAVILRAMLAVAIEHPDLVREKINELWN